MDKDTKSLLDALKKSSDVNKYIEAHRNQMIFEPLHVYLDEMSKKKGISKTNIFRVANINEISGFHYFSGFRHPSRDRLICLCIGMQCNLDETNSLLQRGGFSPLNPRIVRDCYIIWGVIKKLTILQIDDLLYKNNKKTLQNE